MKKLRCALVVSLLGIMLIVLFSSGFGSAVETQDLVTQVVFSPDPLVAGRTATFRIVFESQYSEPLELDLIGLHFDWMTTDGVVGHNFTASPHILQPGETWTCDPIQIAIQSTVSSGTHSYYVAVDGYEGTNADTYFSYTGDTAYVDVVSSSVGGTATPTVKPTDGGNNDSGGSIDLWSIVAIVAVIAVAVIALLVVTTLRKRKTPATAAPAPVASPPPATPPPSQSPS
jgi:hypothetical protein